MLARLATDIIFETRGIKRERGHRGLGQWFVSGEVSPSGRRPEQGMVFLGVQDIDRVTTAHKYRRDSVIFGTPGLYFPKRLGAENHL